MKRISIALLTLLTGAPAFAQNNRVSLNLYTLSGAMSVREDINQPGKFETSTIMLLPTIGYYRMIRGNTGVGLELGYSRTRMKADNTYQPSSSIGFTRKEETRTSADEYYVCPSLFQVITTANKRYRLIPSLGLPFSYIPEMKSSTTSRIFNQETGETVNGSSTDNAAQKTLRIGLMANAAAQIRVVGGFYAGIQFGAGINYRRQELFGETVNLTNLGRPNEIRTTTPVSKNQSQSIAFEFQPAITLNYFF